MGERTIIIQLVKSYSWLQSCIICILLNQHSDSIIITRCIPHVRILWLMPLPTRSSPAYYPYTGSSDLCGKRERDTHIQRKRPSHHWLDSCLLSSNLLCLESQRTHKLKMAISFYCNIYRLVKNQSTVTSHQVRGNNRWVEAYVTGFVKTLHRV